MYNDVIASGAYHNDAGGNITPRDMSQTVQPGYMTIDSADTGSQVTVTATCREANKAIVTSSGGTDLQPAGPMQEQRVITV